MKKIQIFTTVALLAGALCGCLRTSLPGRSETPDGAQAWLSIRADFEKPTRGSGENVGLPAESNLYTLYVVTFNAASQIVSVPGGANPFYIRITGSSLTPEPQLVSAAATQIMVVANPGPGLLAALNALNSTSTFESFNAAITSATVLDMVDHTATRGFAMISTPSDEDLEAGGRVASPLIAVGEKIKVVSSTLSKDDAITEAANDRLAVRIERLSSKVVVKPVGAVSVLPEGAAFEFGGWTLDAVNTTYFPWSEKVILSAAHTSTLSAYAKNFYTEDPNFADNNTGAPGDTSYHSGLAYATIGEDFAPVLPWTDAVNYPNGYYNWREAVENAPAYLVENTMAASAQRFGNATRVVIRGIYTLKDFVKGEDWFNFAGTNYPSLDALQVAYAAATAPDSPLRTACDDFHTRIGAYHTAVLEQTLPADDFAALQPTHLSVVQHGGQVVKNGTNPVIRWYQGGLSYYYYEIRHDNDPAAGTMAYGKYGVVRNNWYNLSLTSVGGAGTPWYPDLQDPGPGDPDPYDPIDEQAGYLGVRIEAQPWIIWETGMSI